MACSLSTDCPTNSTCKDNICTPQCKSDLDCAFNEKCLKGGCMLTCRVDNDCFLGHICLRNKCIFGCHVDDDCGSSESCKDNKCTNPCSSDTCGPNAQCSVVNHRAVCSCAEGLVPNPSANVGCVRTPAAPCLQNADCPGSNFICKEDFCRSICASDSGCLNNERCENGVCKPICRKDDDCRSGEICESLKCTVGCRGNLGCPQDKSCINSKCVDACSSSTACGINAKCRTVEHRKVCECPALLEGNPFEGCKRVLKLCHSKDNCDSEETCFEGVCQPSCKT